MEPDNRHGFYFHKLEFDLASRANLRAWARRRNGDGAAGSDDITVRDIWAFGTNNVPQWYAETARPVSHRERIDRVQSLGGLDFSYSPAGPGALRTSRSRSLQSRGCQMGRHEKQQGVGRDVKIEVY